MLFHLQTCLSARAYPAQLLPLPHPTGCLHIPNLSQEPTQWKAQTQEASTTQQPSPSLQETRKHTQNQEQSRKLSSECLTHSLPTGLKERSTEAERH